MTPDSVGPFTRPFPLYRLVPGGTDVTVEADEAERRALAADLGLVSLRACRAHLRVSGTSDRVRVSGRVSASVEQLCVVTLEPVTSSVDEEVDVTFERPDPRHPRDRAAETEFGPEDDSPDELTGDRIDLGAITAEFLALGLDPYPRKPGADFIEPEPAVRDGPFARLAAFRRSDDEP